MPTVTASRGAVPFLLGVFAVCMCGLMLQIVVTRVISVIAYYHLAFFAISMAMLGMTAGSLLIYFKPQLFPRERLFESLAWISAALSISVFLSTMSLITTVVGAGIANTFVMTAIVWLKLILILLPPYVFAGMAISLALTRSPVPVGVVYGVDLLGAASGCLIILLLLSWTDAISVLVAIAAFAAIASLCFQTARRMSGETDPPLLAIGHLGRGRWPTFFAVVFGLIAIGNTAIQPTTRGQWHDGLVLLLSKGKMELGSPAIMRWNTYSRIMVSDASTGAPALWGPSPITPALEVSQRKLDIDGDAATAMYQPKSSS